MVGVQIEGPEGIAAIDPILAVEHLDLIFLGPFDLSQHLGVPGETSHPLVIEAMADIVRRSDARGVATGTWAPNPTSAKTWIDAGVHLVTVSSSTALFTEAATALMGNLRPAS